MISHDDRIEQLLAQLTTEEKTTLLAGADKWRTVPVERLGIPAIKVSDGPNGARGAHGNSGPRSACFPVGTALAATWNLALVEQVGAALAEETRAKGAHILLAPTVNLHRSPLAGRNFECYSEDPFLTGKMAAAYIKGLQGQGVGACIKHFVCNDSEFERKSISSEVAERPLRELYLRPFEMALREAQPWSLMSAYNRLNGVYASENDRLLGQILKEEWAFDGYVISDWYGTYSPVAISGSLDLEMPGPGRWLAPEKVLAALEAGQVTEAQIDDKVRRLLRIVTRVGAFDQPSPGPEQAIDRPEHRRLARQAAAEAIVLLKNEDDLLPLDPARLKSIAVIGENARWAQIMGGGSSAVNPHYAVSPLAGIEQQVGDRCAVRYQVGCPTHRSLPGIPPEWLGAPERLAASGDQPGLHLEYFASRDLTGPPVHTVQVEKTRFDWAGEIIAGPHFLDNDDFGLRLSGSLTPPESGRYTLGLSTIGLGRLSLDGQVLVDNWTDRTTTESRDIIQRQAEVTLQAGQAYTLLVEYVPLPGTHWQPLRVGCFPALPDDPIQAAVDLAAASDVAVVVAGLTGEWESEGFDRLDMGLPGDQDELIRRVTAANPRTIVILNAGSPLEMPWLEEVPAVLQLWYGGQEMGNALADVLFGDVNPSGRLPTTFPRRLADNPTYINYPGENGRVYYGEGLFIGYRYYNKKGIEPLFPFGHGLSYTRFDYANLVLGATGDRIEVRLEVTNSGSRAGLEVVQLYLGDPVSSLARPPKELKAFAKIALEPGETRTVTFGLDETSLAYYDPAQAGWVAEPGEFEVLVGRSSGDIRLRGQFGWPVRDGSK